MNTGSIPFRVCAKQATAMADFAADRAQAKLDAAIDAEEARDELIAARTQELVLERTAAMAPIDIVAGLQSILEGAAAVMRPHLLSGDHAVVGQMASTLIRMYIEQDCEVEAQEWMLRVERDLSERH